MMPLHYSHPPHPLPPSSHNSQPASKMLPSEIHGAEYSFRHHQETDAARSNELQQYEGHAVVWRWVPLVAHNRATRIAAASTKPRVIYASARRSEEVVDPNILPPLLTGGELREAQQVLSRTKADCAPTSASSPAIGSIRIPEVPTMVPPHVKHRPLVPAFHVPISPPKTVVAVDKSPEIAPTAISNGAGGELEVANLLLNMGGTPRAASPPTSKKEQLKNETSDDKKITPPSKGSSKMGGLQKSPVLEDRYLTEWVSGSVSLHTPEDDDVLSPLHCFMRRYCVEAFSATPEDVATPRYGKSHGFKVEVGQVGIRCLHCKDSPPGKRAERAVCYPSSLRNIYHSIETWQRRHSLVCKCITPWVRKSIMELMESSKTRAGGRRQYWEDSARRLGMVDTSQGVRFCRTPGDMGPIPSQGNGRTPGDPDVPGHIPEGVVREDDKDLVTDYLYLLMEQMQTCRFTEEDRTGGRSKIKDNEVGFPGMQCRHCQGRAGFGRYFPSSVAALSLANSDRNVYNHLQKCRRCPEAVKSELVRLQKDQTQSKNRRGLRKLFFNRIWKRIHDEDEKGTNEDKGMEPTPPPTQFDSMPRQVSSEYASPPYAGVPRHMGGIPPPMMPHGHAYHRGIHSRVPVNNFRGYM